MSGSIYLVVIYLRSRFRGFVLRSLLGHGLWHAEGRRGGSAAAGRVGRRLGGIVSLWEPPHMDSTVDRQHSITKLDHSPFAHRRQSSSTILNQQQKQQEPLNLHTVPSHPPRPSRSHSSMLQIGLVSGSSHSLRVTALLHLRLRRHYQCRRQSSTTPVLTMTQQPIGQQPLQGPPKSAHEFLDFVNASPTRECPAALATQTRLVL